MSTSIEAVSSLTKLTPYTSIDADNSSVSVHDGNFNNFVSNAFAKMSETNTEYKDAVNYLSRSENFSSDPEALVMQQSYMGRYSNHVLLVSTLARKVVATIETLGKAQ